MEIATGISLANPLNKRIIQILAAGFVVLIIASSMTRIIDKSIRIAIGTIAVGIAVDGLASHLVVAGLILLQQFLLGWVCCRLFISCKQENDFLEI